MAAISLASALFAHKASASECQKIIESSFASQFVVGETGQKLAGPSVQPSLTVACPNGFHGKVWGTRALDKNPGEADENDFFLGWAFPITNKTSADITAALFHVLPHDKSGAVDVGHAEATLRHEFENSSVFGTFKLNRAYYDAKVLGNQVIAQLGGRMEFPNSLPLDCQPALSMDMAYLNGLDNTGFSGRVGADVICPIPKTSASFKISADTYTGQQLWNDGEEANNVVNAGIVIAF